MFSIFYNNKNVVIPNTVYPKWSYIEDNIRNNIAKVFRYYRSAEEPVPNQNLLTRLIVNTLPDITLSTLAYVEQLELKLDHITRFGIVDNKSGVVFSQGFSANQEIFYSVQKQTYYYNIENTWRKLVPLRIVYTNNSILDYEIRYGKMGSKDFTIYELDYIQLMLMYREWANIRKRNNVSIKPNIFISQIVLPNMLLNSINIILFNRLIDLFYSLEIPKADIRYPFFLINVEKDVDMIYKEFIKSYSNRRLSIETILSTIPKVDRNTSMLQELRISDFRFTYLNKWLFWFLRLRYIRFLIDFLSVNGQKYNLEHIRIMQKYFLEYQSDKVPLPNNVSKENVDTIKRYIIELRTSLFPNIKWSNI